MEKIKAILCGVGFAFLILVIFLGIQSNTKVKGAESFLCLQKAVIVDQGIAKDQWITDTDLAKVFDSISLVVYPEDKVSLSLPLNVCKGVIIKIDRAPVISLKIGKNETTVRSWVGTVKELLAEQNIVMGGKDKISPGLNTKITAGMNVVLTHWGERIEKKEEAIAYSVVQQPSADLVIGNTQVSQNGKDGKKLVTYKITSVNDDDVSSEKLAEQIITPAMDQILLYGTKPPVISTEYGEISIHNGDVTATNYYSTGALLRITNLDNGKSVTIKVDYGCSNCGPINRMMDLAVSAFNQVCVYNQGYFNAKVEELAQ